MIPVPSSRRLLSNDERGKGQRRARAKILGAVQSEWVSGPRPKSALAALELPFALYFPFWAFNAAIVPRRAARLFRRIFGASPVIRTFFCFFGFLIPFRWSFLDWLCAVWFLDLAIFLSKVFSKLVESKMAKSK